MTNQPKIYDLSVREAAARLDVSDKTIKRWIAAGKIEARKNDSGYWKLSVADLEAAHPHAVVER